MNLRSFFFIQLLLPFGITVTAASPKGPLPEEARDYYVHIQVEGHGTTDPAPGYYYFDFDDPASFTGIPENGATFIGWRSDRLRSLNNPLSFNVRNDHELTAVFMSGPHSADYNGDWKFSLSESLRILQLYNVGALHCDETTEDGYAPGNGDTNCPNHDLDYNPANWSINLSEVLRFQQFYSHNAYQRKEGTEDGFAPGSAVEAVELTRTVTPPGTYAPGSIVEITVQALYTGATPISALVINEFVPSGWTFEGFLYPPSIPIDVARLSGPTGFLRFTLHSSSFGRTSRSFTYLLKVAETAANDISFPGNAEYYLEGIARRFISEDIYVTLIETEVHILSTSLSPPGAGFISLTPPNSPGLPAGSYLSGSSVYATAKFNYLLWQFEGWRLNENWLGNIGVSLNLKMESDLYLQAQFLYLGDDEGEGEGEGEGGSEGAGDGEGEGEGEGIPPMEYHSSDWNGEPDNRIDLTELMRMVQLYNSDGYHCAAPGDPFSDEGYLAGPGDRTCTPHAADYSPQDWRIGLSGLLRIVQFYNSGGYHSCPDAIQSTEDGYCPGLPG